MKKKPKKQYNSDYIDESPPKIDETKQYKMMLIKCENIISYI